MTADKSNIAGFIELETKQLLTTEGQGDLDFEMLRKRIVPPYQALVFSEDDSIHNNTTDEARNMWITLHEFPGDGYNGLHIAFDPGRKQWFIIVMDPAERYRYIRPGRTFEGLYRTLLKMEGYKP